MMEKDNVEGLTATNSSRLMSSSGSGSLRIFRGTWVADEHGAALGKAAGAAVFVAQGVRPCLSTWSRLSQ
jgi:hypothetical protein